MSIAASTPPVVRFESGLHDAPVTEENRYPRKVLEPLKLRWGHRVIEVPEGFETDFASVPKPLWPIFPKGLGRRASTVHDWLYATHQVGDTPVSREVADLIFHQALLLDMVTEARAWAMWAGVRAGGVRAWKTGPKRHPSS